MKVLINEVTTSNSGVRPKRILLILTVILQTKMKQLFLLCTKNTLGHPQFMIQAFLTMNQLYIWQKSKDTLKKGDFDSTLRRPKNAFWPIEICQQVTFHLTIEYLWTTFPLSTFSSEVSIAITNPSLSIVATSAKVALYRGSATNFRVVTKTN